MLRLFVSKETILENVETEIKIVSLTLTLKRIHFTGLHRKQTVLHFKAVAGHCDQKISQLIMFNELLPFPINHFLYSALVKNSKYISEVTVPMRKHGGQGGQHYYRSISQPTSNWLCGVDNHRWMDSASCLYLNCSPRKGSRVLCSISLISPASAPAKQTPAMGQDKHMGFSWRGPVF